MNGNLSKRLTELEDKAAHLSVAGQKSDARLDRLTDDERTRMEQITQRCRRGDAHDLSTLTCSELRELRHLAVLYTPSVPDADVVRLRELYAKLAPYRSDGYSEYEGRAYTNPQSRLWLDEYEQIAQRAKSQKE